MIDQLFVPKRQGLGPVTAEEKITTAEERGGGGVKAR